MDADSGGVVIPQQDYVNVHVDENGRIVVEQYSEEDGMQRVKFWPLWAEELCNAIKQAVKDAQEPDDE